MHTAVIKFDPLTNPIRAGTENDNGTWTLSADDLDGLTMTVPTGAPEFDVQVSATATENDVTYNLSLSITSPSATTATTGRVSFIPEGQATAADRN